MPHGHWKTTTFTARRQGKPRGSRLDAHADFILGLVEAGTKDISLAEIAERLEAERGIRVGITSVWKFLDRRGPHVQNKTAHAAEQQREDVRQARQAWFDGQLDLDPDKLIFIDETVRQRLRHACRPPTRLAA